MTSMIFGILVAFPRLCKMESMGGGGWFVLDWAASSTLLCNFLETWQSIWIGWLWVGMHCDKMRFMVHLKNVLIETRTYAWLAIALMWLFQGILLVNLLPGIGEDKIKISQFKLCTKALFTELLHAFNKTLHEPVFISTMLWQFHQILLGVQKLIIFLFTLKLVKLYFVTI